MGFFLRTPDNEDIVDVEVYVKHEDESKFVELSSAIDIKNYSVLLLGTTDIDKQVSLISDIAQINELRGWLWEFYFASKKNDGSEIDGVTASVKSMLQEIADRNDLYLVED